MIPSNIFNKFLTFLRSLFLSFPMFVCLALKYFRWKNISSENFVKEFQMRKTTVCTVDQIKRFNKIPIFFFSFYFLVSVCSGRWYQWQYLIFLLLIAEISPLPIQSSVFFFSLTQFWCLLCRLLSDSFSIERNTVMRSLNR